ncbi:MAG TPA: DUF1501 domain-containing protein [Polyangiaceae bacterium]|nr:DUF1501 domain-containing protein [Polyangiaceae bacterium]
MSAARWGRRDLLRLGVAAGGVASSGWGREARAGAPASSRPRYYVLINLNGGFDSVYSTDPKRRAEVEAWVDVPYREDAILTRGELQAGPHLAPLLPFAARMAVLNGVQVGTANHDTGLIQAARLRTGVKVRTPTILDLITRHRDGQPLGCVSVGAVAGFAYSPGWFGTMPAGLLPPAAGSGVREAEDNLLDSLQATEPDDLKRLARALRAQGGRLRAGATATGDERAVTAGHLEQVARLCEYLPACKPFEVERWSRDKDQQEVAVHLQRALWVFENDVACGVQLGVALRWDTHTDNVVRQAEASGAFMPMFARFLAALEARRSAGGRLSEQTAVVVGSELGRFPRLNSNRGKDHLSQTPYLFFGPAFRTGGAAFGRTGASMEGLRVSRKTGAPGGADASVPTLDDVGATLLTVAGLNPGPYGYDGKALEFLVAR